MPVDEVAHRVIGALEDHRQLQEREVGRVLLQKADLGRGPRTEIPGAADRLPLVFLLAVALLGEIVALRARRAEDIFLCLPLRSRPQPIAHAIGCDSRELRDHCDRDTRLPQALHLRRRKFRLGQEKCLPSAARRRMMLATGGRMQAPATIELQPAVKSAPEPKGGNNGQASAGRPAETGQQKAPPERGQVDGRKYPDGVRFLVSESNGCGKCKFSIHWRLARCVVGRPQLRPPGHTRNA